MKYLLILLLFPSISFSQPVLKDASVIKVKGVGFLEVCNALLDSGYTIASKDNDLQTAKTDIVDFPKLWNACYIIHIRVKDSVAYISGTFTAPGRTGGLFKDEPITNVVNRKGETLRKSVSGYPFTILQSFALSFGKPVEYLKN